jgi:thymidylate kinase
MKVRPGSAIVLEGVDRAGKSTQVSILASLPWIEPVPFVAHMPSSVTAATRAVYKITEGQLISSPLARQLLHLACHAESLPTLSTERRGSAVILDRWWWSTVAYGWFGGLESEIGLESFVQLVDIVWSGFTADVVFLFLDAYEQDNHNSPAVHDGYRWLAERHPELVVFVPKATPESTTAFLMEELRRREIVEN